MNLEQTEGAEIGRISIQKRRSWGVPYKKSAALARTRHQSPNQPTCERAIGGNGSRQWNVCTCANSGPAGADFGLWILDFGFNRECAGRVRPQSRPRCGL